MNAVIYLDVPDWQIGQDVSIFFPDTMVKHCKCELLKEQEAINPTINEYGEAYCICGENVGIIPNNKNLPSVRTKYCSECGRRMKWG